MNPLPAGWTEFLGDTVLPSLVKKGYTGIDAAGGLVLSLPARAFRRTVEKLDERISVDLCLKPRVKKANRCNPGAVSSGQT